MPISDGLRALCQPWTPWLVSAVRLGILPARMAPWLWEQAQRTPRRMTVPLGDTGLRVPVTLSDETEFQLALSGLPWPDLWPNVLSSLDRAVVLDIGASRGWFALLASRLARRVVSVEADQTRVRQLQKLLHRYRIGEVDPIHARLVSPEATGDPDDPVPELTVDGLVRRLRLRSLDWVHVHPGEQAWALLSGARETLMAYRPACLMVYDDARARLAGWSLPVLVEGLGAWGYTPQALTPAGWTPLPSRALGQPGFSGWLLFEPIPEPVVEIPAPEANLEAETAGIQA